jgi:uncharacterized protein (TIGR02284 family)
MKRTDTIDMLNDLIMICNNRIYIYTYTTNKIDTFDLKAMISNLLTNTKECREVLAQEVKSLGGTVVQGLSSNDVFFRLNKHIKKSILAKNLRLVLISIEFCEYLVIHAYDKAIENSKQQFNADQLMVLMTQKNGIQTNQKKLNVYCEMVS